MQTVKNKEVNVKYNDKNNLKVTRLKRTTGADKQSVEVKFDTKRE